jgi:hypothetical protein
MKLLMTALKADRDVTARETRLLHGGYGPVDGLATYVIGLGFRYFNTESTRRELRSGAHRKSALRILALRSTIQN